MTRVLYLFVAILITPLCACAQLYQAQYSAKPIEAWVVDAATNQPLEDVTVLASWEVEAGEMQARSKVFRIKLLEATTDKGGRFLLPAWGPEANPSAFGYIGSRDPRLILFKPDYRWVGQENLMTEGRPGALRYSDWDGKTIKMQRSDSNADYVDKFWSLNSTLRFILASREEPCNWKRAPMIIAAVMKEERRMKERGPGSWSSFVSYLRSNEKYFSESGCGSLNAFLNGLST